MFATPYFTPDYFAPDHFAGSVPVIAVLVPAGGPLAGGTAVTITGTGFLTGAGVTFAGDAAGAVTVVSPTVITCTTPAHAVEEAVDVVVTNADTQSDTLAGGYQYADYYGYSCRTMMGVG